MSNKDTTPTEIRPPQTRTQVYGFLKELLASRSGKISVGLLGPILIATVFAPVLATQDPVATNYGQAFVSPSTGHIFGTDKFGRDLFARTVYGGRTSLYVGLSSVALALIVGVPVGITAGYFPDKYDEPLMRSMDILMTFPPILLALLLLVILTPSMNSAILAIGAVFSPRIARVARASTLSICDTEFVKACEQRGESSVYIMFYEILPNIRGPIVIEATIRVGYAIIIGAGLSFLGLGVQPPTPDWGFMISVARNEIHNGPWMLLWPTLALSATILGFNLLGDALGDIIDGEFEE